MASTFAVAFMTVMIGSTSQGGAPTVTKETTLIQGSSAMSVCRKLEANFHRSSIMGMGEVKVSVEETDGFVKRESSCVQIPL